LNTFIRSLGRDPAEAERTFAKRRSISKNDCPTLPSSTSASTVDCKKKQSEFANIIFGATSARTDYYVTMKKDHPNLGSSRGPQEVIAKEYPQALIESSYSSRVLCRQKSNGYKMSETNNSLKNHPSNVSRERSKYISNIDKENIDFSSHIQTKKAPQESSRGQDGLQPQSSLNKQSSRYLSNREVMLAKVISGNIRAKEVLLSKPSNLAAS